ncbi:VWA domain-containing protein [Micromonospora sp. KC207]|uniref:vWA domain-containing protein n=1 Tax=Micromonospora sp. KC207 TaxID=2530377 RepID=UPI00104493AF|nr:vWA domain-containing protein [Micromonospora sp. KC207]TDC67006.1 VWA domain-containing protein [Micromonospora sp. KC207]
MTRRAVWSVLAVCLLVLLTAVGAPARAGSAADQAALPEVLRGLRVDTLPADYVVLIDVSASMQDGRRDLYAAARAALRPLLGGLAPVDRLHLIAFAERPDPVFSGDIGANGAAVLGRLPGRAEGRATDIGAAIGAALQIVEQPDATDPATVIMLTDGVHDPPPGSRYAYPGGDAFADLRKRARAVEQRRSVRALGVPLTGRTDVRLLDEVFDDTVLMDLPPEQVGDYLGRVGDRIAVEKAAAYVSRDRLTATIALEPSPVVVRDEPVDLVARVRSTTTRVPLTVRDLAVEVDGLPVTGTVAPAQVTLDPAAPEQQVTIRLRPQALSGTWIGGERTTTGQVRVVGTVDSPWRDVIDRDLGLDFVPQQVAGQAQGARTASGIPVRLVVTAVLALGALAALAVTLRRRRWKPIGGHLLVAEPGTAAPYRQRLSGRKVRFPAAHGRGGTQGTGTVRAVRRPRTVGSGSELVLHIDYRRAGRRHHVVCRPRQPVSAADGTTFTYQP